MGSKVVPIWWQSVQEYDNRAAGKVDKVRNPTQLAVVPDQRGAKNIPLFGVRDVREDRYGVASYFATPFVSKGAVE